MKTPDITTAQIAGKLTFVGGELVAWGLLNGHTEQLVVAIASPALAAALMLADALIRNGRAKTAGIAAISDLAKLLAPVIAKAAPPAS